MKNLKKLVSIVLIACILLLVLAGCSGGTGNSGVSADFKKTMDAYEKFFDEYIAFMKKYQENPADISLLAKYTEFMSEYATMMSKMAALEDQKMTEAEAAYYLEVTNRINQKLAKIAD